MQKYLLLLLIPTIMLSCTNNEFTFSADVDAEIIGTTNNYMGLKYDLYGSTVFQDVHFTGVAEISFFKQMKTIPLTVHVTGHDRDGGDYVSITLTYKRSQFGAAKDKTMDKLSIHSFMTQDDKIHDFTWYKYHEQEYEGGISSQELRSKLSEDGEDPPEIKTVTEGEQVKGDKTL